VISDCRSELDDVVAVGLIDCEAASGAEFRKAESRIGELNVVAYLVAGIR